MAPIFFYENREPWKKTVLGKNELPEKRDRDPHLEPFRESSGAIPESHVQENPELEIRVDPLI